MGKYSIDRVYLGGFLILCICLFYYQIVKGDYYLDRAKNNYVRAIPLSSIRGAIFDRKDIPLVRDEASFNIAVIPYQVRGREDILFGKVADFLDVDAAILKRNYKRNTSSFFSPANIVIDIDKKDALRVKEEFSKDILINPRARRRYVYPYAFSHVLGYAKEAMPFYEDLKQYGYSPLGRAGFLGVEQYYDTYLNGEDGGDLIEVDARGNVVGFLGGKLPQRGKDIQLTLDARFQEQAYRALGGRNGVLILMNPDTGEIISFVSSPSFDLNSFTTGENVARFLGSTRKPMLNRAVQARYPLGSTFKPIVALAALEGQGKTPHTTFVCGGSLKVGNKEFRCSGVHQQEDLYDALAHSCNVYFYRLGLLIGPDVMAQWAKKVGLDSLTSLDLPYEKKGLVPTPSWVRKKLKKGWFDGDTANLSIGQGFIEATPLEVLVAINVFANGGYLVRPHILKKVEDVGPQSVDKKYLGISEDNLNIIRTGMRKAVSAVDGTAHVLKRLNLKIAGKTGTAQNQGRAHGWFAGFFPYDNPKYSICVLLENAGSSYEALKVVYRFLEVLKSKDLL